MKSEILAGGIVLIGAILVSGCVEDYETNETIDSLLNNTSVYAVDYTMDTELTSLFEDYQFYWIYSNETHLQTDLVALSPNREIVNGFNPLLVDSDFKINNEESAISSSKAFVVYYGQLYLFLDDVNILSNTSQIPYEAEWDMKNPEDYSNIIKPAEYSEINGGFSTTLYTWSFDGGYLIKWIVEIDKDNVNSLSYEVIEEMVGTNEPVTEGWIISKGFNYTESSLDTM